MASRKVPTISIEPKNAAGKEKMGYHGNMWYLKEENHIQKYFKNKGPCYVLRSRDGAKILFVQMTDDPDFNVRKVG